MKKQLLILSSVLLAAFAAPSWAQGSKSQAGGLPALAAQLAELQAQVDALSGGNTNPYAGSYTVIIFENNHFGCGSTTDPASVIGLPGGLLGYLQDQGISASSVLTSVLLANSDGETITFSGSSVSRQELRLSGKFETDSFSEGAFEMQINSNGELVFTEGGAETSIGQFADNGSSFVGVSSNSDSDGDCVDANTALILGVRI